MRRLAVALVALVAAAAPARAGDLPLLPVDPFAKAAVGDWESFTIESRGVAQGEHRVRKAGVAFRVSAVADDTVSFEGLSSLAPRSAGKDARLLPVSRREPSFETMLALRKKVVAGVVVVDEKRKVGDAELACKKITFTTSKTLELKSSDSLAIAERWTVWTSAELPAPGLVGYVSETHATGGGLAEEDSRVEVVLAGYGRGDAVAWGKKVDDLPAVDEKAPPPATTPLAVNPYATARVGDWEALAIEMTTRSHLVLLERPPQDETRVDRHVAIWTVTKVTDDVVSFAVEDRSEGKVTTRQIDVRRNEPPSVEGYLAFQPGELEKIAQSDDGHAVAGHTFSGKKVAAEVDRYFPIGSPQRPRWGRSHGVQTAWVSPEVKGRGMVALVVDLKGSGMNGTLETHGEIVVTGYGDADHVLFGTKPEPFAPK